MLLEVFKKEANQLEQFHFAPFSDKALKVLNWWLDPELNQKEALICDGSVRSGKSLIMSISFMLMTMHKFNERNFIFAGKTIGSLRRNVIRTLVSILKSWGWNIKDHRADNMVEVSFNNHTNYYYLFGGKDEGSYTLVQGLTASSAFFDEVVLMPQSFVNQATARVDNVDGKFYFNCNPAGPYHWFKQEWINQPQKHRVLHLHFTMNDNLSLDKRTIDRYERTYSGVFYDRYILGQWKIAENIVYDNFNKDTMVQNPPDTRMFTDYVVSCDYGIKNPTVFLYWGYIPNDDTWYCFKQYYYDGRHSQYQKDDEEYADDMQDFVGNHDPTIVVDPSASSFILVLENRGYDVIKADNDVVPGIRLTQVRMNQGKIKFSEDLPDVFREFYSYVWDKKAQQRGVDKVIKAKDHSMDAMRYFVTYQLYSGYDDDDEDSDVDLYEEY